MLLLYHNDMSVCSQKVRIVLAEKAIPFESRPLDLRRGDSKTPAYLKLNPNGVVPTLVHDGRVVLESVVINEYLDDAFPERPLKPSDLVERAGMRVLTKQIEAGIFAAIGTISVSIAFHHQYSAERIEELTRTLAGWRERFERSRRGTENPAFPDAIRRLDRMAGELDHILAGRPFLAGSAFSLADAAYAPYLTRIDHLAFGGLIRRRKNLSAWYDRMREWPSYRTAVTDWLNPKYLPLMDEKGREAWPKVEALLGA